MKLSFKEWLKTTEMVGTDVIARNCNPTADYQVWGACSDLGKRKKKKKHGKHEGTEPVGHNAKPEGDSTEEIHGDRSGAEVS